MPVRTQILDIGNFVCSPEIPANPAFLEYLTFADRVIHQWQEVQDSRDPSSVSEDFGKRKARIEETFKAFVETFNAHYGLRPVQQSRMFVPVSRYLQRQHPVKAPFAILHCDLSLPLHTVHEFQDHFALGRINAALAEDAPLPWWQRGPHDRPCYLFGECVWELKESEVGMSSEGIVVLFLECSDRRRQVASPACYGSSVMGAASNADYIPERLRGLALRRAGGKCGKCRARQSLQLDYIKPLRPGVEPSLDNIELLCDACYRKKHGLA